MLRAIAFFSTRAKTFSATACAGAFRRPKKRTFSARSSFWASLGDALRALVRNLHIVISAVCAIINLIHVLQAVILDSQFELLCNMLFLG